MLGVECFFNFMKFKNKVVVVTGASRGIGQAICAAFAREGATVVGVARSDLAETGAAVNAAGGNFIAHNADLGTGTQKESHTVIAEILAKAGKIDALVNNAGIIRRAPAKDFSEADWNAVIATNLNSPFFLMQAVGKWWIETGRAQAPEGSRLKLVNIASLLSFQGGITVPAYAASKHGIAGVTKALSNEGQRNASTSMPLRPATSPRKTPRRCAKTRCGTRPSSTGFPKAAGARRKTSRAAACFWRAAIRIISTARC